MPPPIKVELQPHDPQWAKNAIAESTALASILGATLLTVHHVGSTAIPGIHAKPVLDLIPVVTSLSELDRRQTDIEALGYEWWGCRRTPKTCNNSQLIPPFFSGVVVLKSLFQAG